MKHKAEKSLSHITLCDRDKLHSHISDAYRNDISELHKLINCQLTVEELETIPTLENNRNATSLRIFSAMVIRSINIEKLNNDDKEFLLTEYNKLLSSADKYYLTTYFTSSVNTPGIVFAISFALSGSVSVTDRFII